MDIDHGDIRYGDVAHCLRCNQRRMVKRYPGNDPENGPPIKWCSKCNLEVEPCDYCPLCFHEDMRPTPGQTWEHNSWGHGDPDFVEPGPGEDGVADGVPWADETALYYERRNARLCVVCGAASTHIVVGTDGINDTYCSEHYHEVITEMVRQAERDAGWSAAP